MTWGDTMGNDECGRGWRRVTTTRVGALAAAAVALAGCDLGVPATGYVVAAPGGHAVGAEAGDVDGDGDVDLVATTNTGYTVALNDGDGALALTRVDDRAAAYGHTRLVDLDGDGHVDLLKAHQQHDQGDPRGRIEVRLGDGAGGFAGTPWVTTASASIITPPVAGDVDGDGDADVVAGVGRAFDMDLVVWPNRGDGTLDAATVVPSGTAPFRQVVAGDLNGDGRLDLVLAAEYEAVRRVGVLLGTGGGGFTAPAYYETGVYELDSALTLTLADVDGDGAPDVVGTNGRQVAGEPDVFALLNDGAGAFGPAQVSEAPGVVTGLVGADFDGDGTLDVATDRAVLFGAGDGTFPEHHQVVGDSGPTAADLDGDGAPDLAYTPVGGNRLVVMLNALADEG